MEGGNNKLFQRDHFNPVCPPGVSMLPAEDVERGEITEAAAAFLFSPVPNRNVALVPGLQLGCRGDHGPEPACLPSWGWLPSNFPGSLCSGARRRNIKKRVGNFYL